MSCGVGQVDPTCGEVYARSKRAQEGYDQPMRIIWVVLGALLIGAGAVWLAQGLNLPFAPGSYMTGDITWVVIGGIAIVAGVVAVIRGRRMPTG